MSIEDDDPNLMKEVAQRTLVEEKTDIAYMRLQTAMVMMTIFTLGFAVLVIMYFHESVDEIFIAIHLFALVLPLYFLYQLEKYKLHSVWLSLFLGESANGVLLFYSLVKFPDFFAL